MKARQGMVLLEVIVALAIFASVGVLELAMASGSLATVTRALTRDSDCRAADAFLGVVALWPREDLDRHLGRRIEGHWRMTVDRPMPSLYVVALSDTMSGAELLRTALYRPDSVPARAP